MDRLADEIQTVDVGELSRLRAKSRTARYGAQVASALGHHGLMWWALSARLRFHGDRVHREAAIDGAMACAVAELVGSGLKRVIHRPRPTTGVGKQPKSASMPSTHTANAVAYAVAASIRAPDMAVPAGAIAATIAWSRLALNRHYPTDVLVGVALGSIVGASVAFVHRTYDTAIGRLDMLE
jgi:membrane-associated phospholipid phosphatase